MKNVWASFSHPILLLAPMEGVTDTVFRQIVSMCARPDIFMTEFTSAEGYFSSGRQRVADSLRFSKVEKPVIAQIWGKTPAILGSMSKKLSEMDFAGIDINMGCPHRNVVTHGCGAALIKDPDLASKIIRAVKKGAGELPVSVKTRLGYSKLETDTWISSLLKQGLDALIIHGRTVSEKSKVPAHWDEIGKVVEIRNSLGVKTKIIGNGDVRDAKEANDLCRKYGTDGVMIGRGIFENLRAFDRSKNPHIPTSEELLQLMEKHIKLFLKTWKTKKNHVILKKFYKIYIKDFHDASKLRERCMEAKDPEKVLQILYRQPDSNRRFVP